MKILTVARNFAFAAALGFMLGALAGSAHCQVNQKAMVSIEFDDGFQSAYDIGIPMFNNAGIPITACIITGHLNTPNYMSTAEVVTLDQSGKVEMCSHTRNHYDLSTLSLAQQQTEVVGGKQDLEAIVGHTVNVFAYPFGHHGGLANAYNNAGVSVVMQAGFQSAGTVYGTTGTSYYDNGTDAATNPYIMGRYPFTSTTSSSYMHAVVDYAINHNKWVIILLHSVDDPNSSISINSSQISDLISYIQSKGTSITVVTRAQGLTTLGLTSLQR